MKTPREEFLQKLGCYLAAGVTTVLLSGCMSADPANTDSRAWGRSSEYDQREAWRRDFLFGSGTFVCPQFEQQRNEEWLRSH